MRRRRVATVRIQGEINEDKMPEVKSFMQDCGVETIKELINNALTFLKRAVEERKKGRIIASIDPAKKSYNELSMSVLDGIRKSP